MKRLVLMFKKLRRFFSRSEWLVRLLSLDRSADSPLRSGVILIQIDGLSRTEFEKAIQAGRMPFLKKCPGQKHRLVSHYSGLPSTTPAVQAELFYGVPTAVPAFSFRHHQTQKMMTMIQTDDATLLEQRLQETGKEAFSGGSVYSDMYTGGADKVNFCASRPGLDSSLRQSGSLALFVALILHGFMFLRMLVLFVIEMVLAVFDIFLGLFERKSFLKELTFIPHRIGVCILLRELVAAGVMLDAALGMPVIHCNLLGYDEQAHRRGPSSTFAHWTLKGIDACIRRICRFARSSAYREYDVWIYSDHGQEATIPYESREGRTIQQAVADILRQGGIEENAISTHSESIQLKRVSWIGSGVLPTILEGSDGSTHNSFSIAADGPVGHLYLSQPLDAQTREIVGKALAHEAGVPVVMATENGGKIRAWTRKGTLRWPEEAAAIIGRDHPFFEEVCQDAIRLVQHADAGDFVLFGWGADAPPLNFGFENGGHGGFGPQETHGFLLLPQNAELAKNSKTFLRPADVHQALMLYQRS